MKKFYSFLITAIFMLAIPMGMMGQTRATVTDVLNRAFTGVTSGSTSYSNWTDKTSNSDAVYAGNSAGQYDAIQLRTSGSPSGIVSTTSGGKVTNVSVTWNSNTATGRKLNIYGKNTAYSAASDLHNANTQGTLIGTIDYGSTTSLDITGDYTFIGIRSYNGALYLDEINITWTNSSSTTYTVTYDCNGGETDCPENVSGIAPGTSITLASAPSRPHFNFEGWTYGATTYNSGDSYTVNSNVTFVAQWESDGTYEGSICFSNQSSCTAINSQSVTGEDDLDNTWTITTTGTSSFTSNSGYYQVGSGNSPATSITFTTTLDEEVNVTDFSAKFGGFSATRASVVLKVDDTQVGSGTLNGAADVTVSSSSAQIGTTLTVVVTPTAGGVKCYNISYAYETIEPSQAVSTTTAINVPQNFNTDIYQGTTAGTLTATVTPEGGSALENPAINWSSSNTGVATIDANGAVTLVAVGTTTITASYAGVEDQYRPSTGTYELTVTDSNAPGTQNNPYTVAQAIAATPSSGTSDNVYIHGIVSKFHNNSIVGDGTNYRYYISDDGTTSTELLVYKGKGLNNVAFSDANDLLVGDVVTIYGGLTTYGSTKEVAADNFIVSLARPAQYTLTNAMTNVAEYFVFVGDDEIEFDNNNQAQVRAGATVYVSLTMEDCYSLTSLTVNGSTTGVTEEEPGVYYSFVMPEGDATIGVSATQATQYTLTVAGLNNVTYTDMLAGVGSEEVTLTNNQATLCEGINVDIAGLTANAGLLLQSVTLNDGTTTTTLKLESGVYHFTMPSSNATLTFTTTTTPTYTLANSIDNGRHYIITNGSTKAMGAQSSNNRAAVDVDIQDGIATVTSNEVYEFVINGPDANGYYTIYDVHNSGYLYAAGSGSGKNYLRNQDFNDANGKWSIVIDNEDKATITAQGNQTNNLMRYNSNNTIFSCYASGQQPIYLYVKDETTPQYDFYKDIAGYGSNNNVATGWNFIALPVTGSFTPDATMTSNTYDLYQLNDIIWQNYKEDGDNAAPGFNLINGKGYLYANSNNVTLHFSGAINTFTEEGNANQKELSTGWNFIGNPYNIPIYINKPYYKMNAEGSAIETAEDIMSVAIPACTGVIVNADENETVTFSTTASKSSNNNRGNIQMALVQSIATRGESNVETIDNAIISFNEGNQLEKFYFGTQNANLYIQQGAEEYAIVSAEAQGEMPVNFKASQSGEYTISINTENVEMNYLHLIDNLTGNDVDLLATPSYTFNAMADDYASRFRLVFSANNAESNNDNFAFISDGQIVLTEQGDAQVFDVMGRMISRHNNVSHITTEGLAAGVYVIRLTTGSETMTQKIVVK